MKRTTVRLPTALLQEAKALAARKHTTVTELIETGLRMQLEATQEPPPPELPICRESLKSNERFAKDLPADAATWSLGRWEEWFDLHPQNS